MSSILPIAQITISVLLIVAILLQRRGSGLSGIFGAGGGGSYHTKRGFEKILFTSTIILGTFFLLSALVALLI